MASAPEKRLTVVSFRLTDAETAHIDAAASAMAPPRSRQDWCRAAALHVARAKVPEPPPGRLQPRRLPSPATQAAAAALARLGALKSDIDRLVRGASQDQPPSSDALQAISDSIGAVANDLRTALEGRRGDQG